MIMTKMIMSREKTRTGDDDDDACNSNSKSCNNVFLNLKVTLGIQEYYTLGRRVSSFGEKSSFSEEWEYKDWEATPTSKFSESSNRWNKCCCIIWVMKKDERMKAAKLSVLRVEICRDRHDQRSGKTCASCVNFPGKQRDFLYNLHTILHTQLNSNKKATKITGISAFSLFLFE